MGTAPELPVILDGMWWTTGALRPTPFVTSLTSWEVKLDPWSLLMTLGKPKTEQNLMSSCRNSFSFVTSSPV